MPGLACVTSSHRATPPSCASALPPSSASPSSSSKTSLFSTSFRYGPPQQWASPSNTKNNSTKEGNFPQAKIPAITVYKLGWNSTIKFSCESEKMFSDILFLTAKRYHVYKLYCITCLLLSAIYQIKFR